MKKQAGYIALTSLLGLMFAIVFSVFAYHQKATASDDPNTVSDGVEKEISAELSCENQAWPLISENCLSGLDEDTADIRVISRIYFSQDS